MTYKIQKRIVLNLNEKHGFKNIHTVKGEKIPPPHELQIVTYSDVEGFYLLYIDLEGEVITDTYHESLTKAFEQAAWEFNVLPSEWSDVD
jgi:hypothetical protein